MCQMVWIQIRNDTVGPDLGPNCLQKLSEENKSKERVRECKNNLFDLILYVSVNNFSVMSRWVFLGFTSTKQGLMCLAQGHSTMTLMRLEPATPQSGDKSTLPLSHCAPIENVIYV